MWYAYIIYAHQSISSSSSLIVYDTHLFFILNPKKVYFLNRPIDCQTIHPSNNYYGQIVITKFAMLDYVDDKLNYYIWDDIDDALP